MKTNRLKSLSIDVALCLSLMGGYLTALLRSVKDLGYSRDEGFYFQAADTYLRWFRLLGSQGTSALKRSSVDTYWSMNHEHPALIKSLFAASRAWLYDKWHIFPEPGTSYRFVGMCFAALTIGILYVWARRSLPAKSEWQSRFAAVFAALAFACMPRVFYHSHLDCFDIPVLAMWLLTTYAYWECIQRRSWTLTLLVGVLYGLLLNTKHNSWLLPFALVAHLLLTQFRYIVTGLGRFRLRVPPVLFAMALLGPAVFYAMWPWIWFDTYNRLREYVVFHTAHVYYNIEFLGQTYFRPPFPRLYAWVMTASTVPAITLVLAALGIFVFLKQRLLDGILPTLQRLRAIGVKAVFREASGERPIIDLKSTQVLWLLCVITSYAPWFSNRSPIFGGTKHWMTAYPFMALFAAQAWLLVSDRLSDLFRDPHAVRAKWVERLTDVALLAFTLIGPIVMTRHSHPWGLTSYTPIVGAAPGAASLGLNRSFWGYTTGAVQDYLNRAAPKGARVFIHDTAMQSWQMMEADGRLRKDLKPQLDVSGSQFAIYHHEQHMARVEQQIWVEYGTTQPAYVGAFDGVPVVWVYKRPTPAE
jgi:4-amino-4-deoxy-L-arabinose transferase-like glycosyltransferase